MGGNVIDSLIGHQQFGSCIRWLAAARVASVARVCPTRNLNAEAMRGRPEIEGEV